MHASFTSAIVEKQRAQAAVPSVRSSLMTTLGVVEGDVLAYLERNGSATLRELNRQLRGPAYLVMMGVGALVRAGLVRGVQSELSVILTLRKPLRGPRDLGDDQLSEARPLEH